MDLTNLYFAYGAHMHSDYLRMLCGRADAVNLAYLSDYQVAFFGHDRDWDSGMESIVPTQNGETWGVVYSLDAAAWERLDKKMGAGLEGNGAYFHYPVEVRTTNGHTFVLRTYRKDVQGTPRQPSVEYLALITAGAAAHGLPESYRSALGAIPAQPAKRPVPIIPAGRSASLRIL